MGSVPDSRISAARPVNQRSGHHHFCVDHKAADSAATKDQRSQCDSSSVCSSEAEQDLVLKEQDSREHSPASRSHSPQQQQQQAADVRGSPDQPYNSYKVSAVNKLVSELARKQHQCCKAKLHAVVRLNSPKAHLDSTAHFACTWFPWSPIDCLNTLETSCPVSLTVHSPPIYGVQSLHMQLRLTQTRLCQMYRLCAYHDQSP